MGLGNSALGRKARDLKVRNVKVMPIPDAFGAFGGIPLTPFDPDVDSMDGTGNGTGNGNYNDDNAEKDTALWAEYQKECEKAKKRAVKFGIEYKQPAPDAFFKWSEARGDYARRNLSSKIPKNGLMNCPLNSAFQST